MGLFFMLLANLLFALNIFAMTVAWKWSVGKAAFAFAISPLKTTGGEGMKNGFVIFLAAFVCWAFPGALCSVAGTATGRREAGFRFEFSDVYPVQRPGEATLGLQVYRANGCAACHTEQVRQDGVACEVVLTGAWKKSMSPCANLFQA